MAVPHLSISSISRSAGANAVDRAAYRHATQMEAEAKGPTGELQREGRRAEALGDHAPRRRPDMGGEGLRGGGVPGRAEGDPGRSGGGQDCPRDTRDNGFAGDFGRRGNGRRRGRAAAHGRRGTHGLGASLGAPMERHRARRGCPEQDSQVGDACPGDHDRAAQVPLPRGADRPDARLRPGSLHEPRNGGRPRDSRQGGTATPTRT